MSNKKQTVTFTLTGAQALKWAPVLKSKEGIKTLTPALAELKKLQLYKEKLLEKLVVVIQRFLRREMVWDRLRLLLLKNNKSFRQ